MAMQRLLLESGLEDDVNELSSQVADSQLPSPHAMFSFSQPQLGMPHNFGPMLPSASPMFFHTPFPVQQVSQVAPPPAGHVGAQAPRANATNSKKGVKRASYVLLSSKLALNGSESQIVMEGGQAKNAIDVEAATGKVRVTKRAKGKKKSQDSQGPGDEDDNETGKAAMWKDFWVVTLIHERGGLNEEFNKPQKQSTDLWSRIANKLTSTFSDFDKDSEACRKKWGRVYDQYKADKLHNSISGNDTKKTCKWFDLVDEYMHDRAHVRVYSHASSLGEKGSFSESNATSDQLSKCIAGNVANKVATTSNSARRPVKKDPQLEELLASVKGTGDRLVTQTQLATERREEVEARREAAEARRLDILENLGSALVRLMDQVSNK